jgi:hypothetical protein
MKVHEALSAVMADVQAVGKTGRNESQNFSFRGVDATVNAVGPALRTHGVIVLPRVLSKTYQTFNTRNGALMHEAVLEVEFTFVGPEGDTLVCSAMGESADSGDKATAKAHSVAFRTALLQALCIPTDDPDPDGSSYERTAPYTAPPREPKEAKYAKQDVVWRIKKDHPGLTPDEVKAIAIDVWEWGGLDDTAEVTPDDLDELLGHIGAAVIQFMRDASEGGSDAQ